MKKTTFTLTLTLLLMAMLCFTASAQTWTFNRKWSPWGVPVQSVAFYGNNTVFFDQNWSDGDRYDLYKWNLSGGSWSRDVGDPIKKIEIPVDDNYFVAYAKDGTNWDWTVGMRYTSDMSWRGGFVGVRNRGDIFGDMAVSADGDRLVIGVSGSQRNTFPRGGRVVTWDISAPDATDEGSLLEGNRTQILALAMDWAGGYFFVADGDQNTDERHFHSGSISEVYDSGSKVISLAYRNGLFATGCQNNRIHLWDYNPPGYVRTFWGAGSDPRCLAFSKDGRYLAAGTPHGRVYVWRVNDGVLLDTLYTVPPPEATLLDRQGESSYRINDVAFSDNGHYIAAATGKSYAITSRSAYLFIWSQDTTAAPTTTPQAETPIAETTLLPNFPNPFNPETWIPYQLAKSSEVTVSIHAADGKLVRTLELGQMPAGAYQDKDRAAYWDGKNEQGESVASGVYFYTLKAGDFSATKKMLIRK